MFTWLRKFLRLAIGESMATVTGLRKPLGYQQILNATLATATTLVLTDATKRGMGYAVIQCLGGAVRWRDDGTAPTASVGMTIPANGELDYCGDLNAIQFIASSGTPILDVSVYN